MEDPFSQIQSQLNYDGSTDPAGTDNIVHLTGLNILKSCIHYMSDVD